MQNLPEDPVTEGIPLLKCKSGLPYGIFEYKKLQIWYIFEVLGIDECIIRPFGIFYDNVVYFVGIWYIFGM
jgi:hypothetical protein